MSPTMQKILEEFDTWRNDGEHCSIDDTMLYSFDVLMIKEFIQRACVEYASSIITEAPFHFYMIPIHFPKDMVESIYFAIDHSVRSQIQQDSQDLPTNS